MNGSASPPSPPYGLGTLRVLALILTVLCLFAAACESPAGGGSAGGSGDSGGGGGSGGSGFPGGGGGSPSSTVVNADLDLTGKITAPVTGTPPDTTGIDTIQYTGTVAWQTGGGAPVSGNFAAGTVYKAVVTLAAKSGFTFTGFTGAFSHTGAASVSPYAGGTVTVTFSTALTGVGDVGAYISSATTDPVPLPVDIDLASDWSALLSAIETAGKAVALDLSACTMTGMTGTPGEFDPGAAAIGKDKIVSLILPDAAEIIKAGSLGNPTFKDFDNLERVSGEGIITVGESAFEDCHSLETVSLPAAVTIGVGAFDSCVLLKTVSLPAAETIDVDAFAGCGALETVSLPAATTIAYQAFYLCAALETVSLPAATTIGNEAFNACTTLETVSLPAVPPTLGSDVFVNTNTGAGAMLTIRVPSGAVSAYTSAWGVSADTAANGNTGKYGSSHKWIVITDTP